jgi:hypothetical protein
MAIIDASPQELRDALISLRSRYLEMEEPRRWYSALVCAVLVKLGHLPEWTDWMLEPPQGAIVKMTPAVNQVVDLLFGTPTEAVMRTVPNGVVSYFGNPRRMTVDPLRQSGRVREEETLCVVVDRKRLDVPLSDPSWIWNPEGGFVPAGHYGDALPEIKHSGDYGRQQGILCDFPADQLFALGPELAQQTLSTPRPQCPNLVNANVPRRARASDVGDPPTQVSSVCRLSMQQCASKGAGTSGPGGPRGLIPDSDGSKGRLLAPGAFDRMLDDANPNGVPLPSGSQMALVLDYLHKGRGKALDFNRLHQLVAPEHFALLFEP